MPNLDTLDTVIAMVVVLLVLSLVVQSIQTFLKKLLKMKSRSIQESLEDLFQHVLGVDAVSEASRAGGDGSNPDTSHRTAWPDSRGREVTHPFGRRLEI